jgi:hypothetical protein
MSNATQPRNLRAASCTIRFNEEVLARIDAHTVRMRQKNPHLQISRTDAINDLVGRALFEVERAR